MSMANPAETVLNFFPESNRWSITSASSDDPEKYKMVSLVSLMADNAAYPLRDEPYDRRVALALILAYAFLQLGNSLWFPYDMDDINVWFYQAPGCAPNLLQPFLEVCLDTSDSEIKGRSDNYALHRLINPNMRCLPALGRLMLELISGMTVELLRIDQFIVGYKRQFPERAPYVWGAIEPCIVAGEFTSEIIHGNEALRMRFLEEVIYRLHVLLLRSKTSLEGEIAKARSHPIIRAAVKDQPLDSSVDIGLNANPESSQPVPHTSGSGSDHLDSTCCLHDDGSRHVRDKTQYVEPSHNQYRTPLT
jgi:hypothetical protein